MADPFSFGFDSLASQGWPNSLPRRRSRPQPEPFVLSPEEESSVIKSTLRGGLSGLAFVGNVLDTPGSMVRNALVGRNPFQGFLSPENRTTGRELLEKAGMLRKNKPGFDWGDVAGVAAEIATDPLLFTGAFGAGLSKSGKAAKALGILGEAPKVASAQLGRQVGKRAGRMNLTLNELVQGLDPAARQAAQEGLQRMAQTKGQAGAAWLQDVGNQRLGGLFEAGIPFGPRAAIGGPGGVAESIAGKLDTAGNALRWSYPGRQAARILNPQVFGTNTAVVQREAPGLFKAQTESRIASNKFTEEVIDFRARHNLGDDAEDMLRELYESKTHNAPGVASRISQQFNVPQQELLQLRRYHRAKLISILREGREWGVKGSRYSDPEINYFPRSLAFTSKSGTIFGAEESASRLVPGGQRALTAAHEHSIHRKEFLSGIRGGTATIKRIAEDPDLLLLMDQQGGTTKDIANFIKQRYGAAGLDLVPEKYTHRGAGGAMVDRNRYKAMANWLSRFDKETRAAGIYGNGTVYEMARRLDHYGDAIGAVKTVLNVLQDPSVWKPTTTAARHPESRTLLKTLNKLGIEAGNETRGFLKKLAEAEGLPITPQTIADLGKRHLDVNVARDLAYVMKPFNSPTELKGFMMAVDSMSNYFKAMVTGPWVAFANRNFGSGQFRNWTAEMFSPWSVKAVWDTIRGNPLSGKAFDRIAAIPLVREEAQRLGVQLTPDTAREIVSRLGRRYSLIGRYQGEIAQRTGPAGQALSTAFADEVAGFPGGLGPMKRPASFKRILRKYAGRDPNVTWSLNPLKGRIRGVLGSPETTFAPVAAGEDLNFVVESMNRLAPWLHELAKGTDPLVAKLKVGAAQVEYGSRNFTPFERQWMTRLFPFYKFQSRQIPYVIRELWERPGGKTGQAIRAATAARDPGLATPEYVSESTSIPLPGGPAEGHQRFLTGLGLMHEDPLRMMAPSIQQSGQELLGRLSPMIKAPMEMVLGRSFFQKGRALEDMDPLVGRIAANVAGAAKLEPASVAAEREAFRMPVVAETAISNSPFARALTTARQLTDPRKRATAFGLEGKYPIPGLAALAQLATGVRVTDVSPAAQDAILRDELANVIKKTPGSSVFERAGFSKDELAKMPEAERTKALQLQAVMNMLADKAKERKKLREQAAVERQSVALGGW